MFHTGNLLSVTAASSELNKVGNTFLQVTCGFLPSTYVSTWLIVMAAWSLKCRNRWVNQFVMQLIAA